MKTLSQLKHYVSNEKNDKKIQSKIKKLLIKYTTRIVNSTNIKEDLSPNDDTIEKTINNRTLTFIEKKPGIYPRHTRITYTLPSPFFSEPVLNALEGQNETLQEYPELIYLFESTGLQIITEYTEEIEIPLINYFITETHKNELKETTLNDHTYKTYATYFPLLDNIIRILSYIIGEKTLRKALFYDNTDVILEAITSKTKSNLLTLEFSNAYYDFNYTYRDALKQQEILTKYEQLYKNKILPIKTTIEKIKNPHQKADTIRHIEECGFDIDDYYFHYGNYFNIPNIQFTDEEIACIKEYRSLFNAQYRKADNFLNSYLYQIIPKQELKEKKDLKDFNWIEKFEIQLNVNKHWSNQKNNLSIRKYSETSDKLLEIIAFALKHQSLDLTKDKFEEMLTLMTYQTTKKRMNLRREIQIKQLKRNINKKDKNKKGDIYE